MYIIFDELTKEEFHEQFLELLKNSDLTPEDEDFEFMDSTANYYLKYFNIYLKNFTEVMGSEERFQTEMSLRCNLDSYLCLESCCDHFGDNLSFSSNIGVLTEQSLFIRLMSFRNFLNNRERERRRGLHKNKVDNHFKRIDVNKAKNLKSPLKYIRLCKLYKLMLENEEITLDMIDNEIIYTKPFGHSDDLKTLRELGFGRLETPTNSSELISQIENNSPSVYISKNNTAKEKMLHETSRLLIMMNDFPLFLERQKDVGNNEHKMTLEDLYLEMFKGTNIDDMKKDLDRLKKAGIEF